MARKPTKPTLKKQYEPASWEARFLELYGQTCNVTLSAKGADIDRTVVYDRRKKHPHFAKLMDEAEQTAIEYLEAEAWKRARNASDTLMIFLLKAHKPAKYQETRRIQIDGLDDLLALAKAKGIAPSELFAAMIQQFADAESESK